MIRKIEDLLVWQKARSFNKIIYSIVADFPTQEKSNLVSQLIRASTSICANITEGFARYHSQESVQFYRIARGSLSEVRSHLYLSSDQEYIDNDKLQELLLLIDEIGKMLNGLINKTSEYRNSSGSSKL